MENENGLPGERFYYSSGKAQKLIKEIDEIGSKIEKDIEEIKAMRDNIKKGIDELSKTIFKEIK